MISVHCSILCTCTVVSQVFTGMLQYNFYCFFFLTSNHHFFSYHTIMQPNMALPHLHLLPSNHSPLSLPPKQLQQNKQVQMSANKGQTSVIEQWGLALMSLLIRYAHIPFYFRFSFTFPTSPIHPYAPPLQRDCTRPRSRSHDNRTRFIRPILLI